MHRIIIPTMIIMVMDIILTITIILPAIMDIVVTTTQGQGITALIMTGITIAGGMMQGVTEVMTTEELTEVLLKET